MTTASVSAIQATDHMAPWSHMGWAGPWFMWIFWLALLLLIIVGIRWLSASAGDSRRPMSEDAESILRRRYAAGEIDEQTFRRMRDELRR